MPTHISPYICSQLAVGSCPDIGREQLAVVLTTLNRSQELFITEKPVVLKK